ncbi:MULTISPECIES: YheV family putative zinc ribbon protein [Corallincola]|uniref:DNA-binding protein n=3 Tax=Corallincola TaxID=1775176 RepID=A0A368N2D0_9GAMM|nr:MULTISPECIES: YheV family putative zinc ribbon protein [Corallincola]RCU43784.1 DNA-binding protein [Corallincola holothuriorum]TAA46899.1 YheV family putative metal-binding protein [Corallincola spongiicola]TCI04547.1 YheV family putative metal-binding protein [Corallincola luteus]
MARQRKRFIAGATCPECQQQDTIMVYFEDDVEQIACVACDYHALRPEQGESGGPVADDQLIGIFKPD